MTDPAPAAAAASKLVRAGVPMWAKALVASSIALMGVGLATPLVVPHHDTAPTSTAPSGNGANIPGVTGFTDGSNPQPAPAENPAQAKPTGIAAWSPTIFALGFSFFVGFAMAYALRMFLRLALIGAGFFFMLMFGLQYAGLVEVKWAAMESRYDSLTSHLNEDAHSVTDYITAYLPSAASASAGLIAGFWRRK